jgi:hypothetical protein
MAKVLSEYFGKVKVIKEERKAFEDLWVTRESHLDDGVDRHSHRHLRLGGVEEADELLVPGPDQPNLQSYEDARAAALTGRPDRRLRNLAWPALPRAESTSRRDVDFAHLKAADAKVDFAAIIENGWRKTAPWRHQKCSSP